MPAATVNSEEPVCTASPVVPVTKVPIGKVKDHQVSENGRPARAVRTVMAPAIPAHSRANPQTGTP